MAMQSYYRWVSTNNSTYYPPHYRAVVLNGGEKGQTIDIEFDINDERKKDEALRALPKEAVREVEGRTIYYKSTDLGPVPKKDLKLVGEYDSDKVIVFH